MSDTGRDELAKVIAGRDRYENNWVNYNAIADAVLAAGYRKPVAVEGDAGALIAEAHEYVDALQGGESANWSRVVQCVDMLADLAESQQQRIRDLEDAALGVDGTVAMDFAVRSIRAAESQTSDRLRAELATDNATIARVREAARDALANADDSEVGWDAEMSATALLAILDASPGKGGQD